MKKPAIIIFCMLVALVLLINGSFALWTHEAEVSFTLNISQPEEEEFNCGSYTTIQEGIDLLSDSKYNYIYIRLEQFEDELGARIIELNNLPFGGITHQELEDECDYYRNVIIADFGDVIRQYGDCIRQLADFYRNSSKEEKNQVPDFWDQHDMLWDLHDELWNKREDLYDLVNAVWLAGEDKIDYNNGKNK